MLGFTLVAYKLGTRSFIGSARHKASVRAGSRRVDLVLTAIPMGLNPEEVISCIGEGIEG